MITVSTNGHSFVDFGDDRRECVHCQAAEYSKQADEKCKGES